LYNKFVVALGFGVTLADRLRW